MNNTPRVAADSRPATQVRLVFAIVFVAFLGQMTLSPVIAPLSRELRLAEWQVGFMISVAAITVVLSSQFWGRRSQSWGSRPVFATAMGLATVAMVIFALLAGLGIRGIITGLTLFLLLVLTRGLLFGAALAAMAPTAQTYIANVTDSEQARVRGMAGIGAAQGMATIAGAVVGGLLAGVSLMLSIGAVPVILFVGLLLVLGGLRRGASTERVPDPPRVSALDTRVWPFLVAGFGLFTALGFVQIVTGFLVQDRFDLDGSTTGLVTGAAMLAAGLGMVLAQVLVVPHSGWRPGTLLKVGTFVGTLGFVAQLIDGPIALLITGVGLIGLGIGIAMPGYTAGPTMLMRSAEQGGLAGLIGATNGLTFVIAPTLSTALYGIWPLLPIVVGGLIMFSVFVFVFVHRRFRELVEIEAPRGQEGSFEPVIVPKPKR